MAVIIETAKLLLDNATNDRLIEVTVRNDGKKQVHLPTRPSNFEYEPASALLTVNWNAPQRDIPEGVEFLSDRPEVVPQTVLAPGEITTLRVKVPRAISSYQPGVGLGGLGSEETIIGNVGSLDAEVAYSPTPFSTRAIDHPTPKKSRVVTAQRRIDDLAEEIINSSGEAQ